MVFFIVLLYFLYVSFHFGWKYGIVITLLTWSFFVLCTPIADAGLLLDFPLRVLLGIRMIKSEMAVWAFAITLNIFFLTFNPEVYNTTVLLQLFYHILTTPSYWIIIVLSAIGTFLSIHFGDELLDVIFHRDRIKYFTHKELYELIVFLTIILLVIALYEMVLDQLGIRIL